MISHRIQALAETAEEMYEAADNSAGLHSLRILFCVRYIGVISDSQPHQTYSASLPGLFKLVWKKKIQQSKFFSLVWFPHRDAKPAVEAYDYSDTSENYTELHQLSYQLPLVKKIPV